MQQYRDKFFYILLIVVIVFIILFSNLGQNFKNDITSSNNIINHIDTFKNAWDNNKQYQGYLDASRDYIMSFFADYNIKPLKDSDYIEEWSSNLPSFKYPSSLEVLSKSKYGRIVKSYKYGEDFFEDFRGSIKPGIFTASGVYIKSLDSETNLSDKILLFDGYANKSPDEIINIDSKIRSLGAAAVISPSYSNELKSQSGLYDDKSSLVDGNLIKLIVSQQTFNELKKFSKDNYIIKIKSGGEIKPTKLRNIYGFIKGKNSSYKPLILVSFYDGIYNTPGYNNLEFERYVTAPSVLLDTIRAVKYQRTKVPDRSIVFAFISGYMYNKQGLERLFSRNLEGNILILDGLGSGDTNFISYSKPSKYLGDSVEYYLHKNNFKVTSKSVINSSGFNFLYLTTSSLKGSVMDYQRLYRSGKFLLSLTGGECYNIDFLSGNIAAFRSFKRFIKDNSVILSLFTMIFLIFIVFKDSNKKYH